ncbi:hypothetical protein H6F89_33355 [Cyanobacteria bacterium FACHB-63]|nr:hypothetical protein [Cyanobacteria bacterium FACHB-63]
MSFSVSESVDGHQYRFLAKRKIHEDPLWQQWPTEPVQLHTLVHTIEHHAPEDGGA